MELLDRKHSHKTTLGQLPWVHLFSRHLPIIPESDLQPSGRVPVQHISCQSSPVTHRPTKLGLLSVTDSIWRCIFSTFFLKIREVSALWNFLIGSFCLPTALQHVGLLQGPLEGSWVPSRPKQWLGQALAVCGVLGSEWPLLRSWVACSPLWGPGATSTSPRLRVGSIWSQSQSPRPLSVTGVSVLSSFGPSSAAASFSERGIISSALSRLPFLDLEHHCVGDTEKKIFFLINPRYLNQGFIEMLENSRYALK